jgi:Transglutaminase-like superfamily
MATEADLGVRGRGEEHSDFRTPSVLRCGLMLFAVKAALRISGFGATMRWIRRRAERAIGATPASARALAAAEHSVAMAGALYPGRALCLEQSLVLYDLLRQRGVAVRYCQGAQPHPFEAHAWVEYRGKPINDIPEHVKRFARFPSLLP